jgi:hypothetical protein
MTLNDLAEEARRPKPVGVLALTAFYWFAVRQWLWGGLLWVGATG